MEQEILTCLQALAAGEQGGAGQGAVITAGDSSSAAIDASALPTPWLLLDLAAMLPEGSRLRPTDPEAQHALSAKICQAGRRAPVAAWELSRENAQHSTALEQLADYLLDSPAALDLVVSSLRWRSRAAAGAAAAAEAAAVAEQLTAAAWRRWRANTLPLIWGATKPQDLATEAQQAQEGLVAATQLTHCSWELTGSGAPLLAVLQQYGDHLLLTLHKLLERHTQHAQQGGSGATHSSRGCTAGSGPSSHVGSSAAMQHRLHTWVWWWAANACCLVSQHVPGVGTALRASLELSSLSLHTTLAAACGSQCLSLGQLQPGGPLDYMINLLEGLLRWTKQERVLREAALDLLLRHGMALLRALSALLTAPADGPLQLLSQQAEFGSCGQGSVEHFGQLNAACEVYIGCVEHVLACLRLAGVLQHAGVSQQQASRAAALLQATAQDGSCLQGWLSRQCALELACICRGAVPFFEDFVVRCSTQRRSGDQQAGGGGVMGRLAGTIGRALGFGNGGGRGRR